MKSKWDSCPASGSAKIKCVKKTLTFNTKKGEVKVPNLIFDEEANKKIDTYVSRSAKKAIHSI